MNEIVKGYLKDSTKNNIVIYGTSPKEYRSLKCLMSHYWVPTPGREIKVNTQTDRLRCKCGCILSVYVSKGVTSFLVSFSGGKQKCTHSFSWNRERWMRDEIKDIIV